MKRLLLPALLGSAVLLGACDGGGNPTEPRKSAALNLEVGGVFTTTAAATDTFRIEGQPGAEYVLVPFFASQSANDRLPFAVAGAGLAPVGTSPASASRLPGGAPLLSLRGAAEENAAAAWEDRLRRVERRELTPRVAGAQAAYAAAGRAGASFSTAPGPQLQQVGETMRFNVRADSGCANPVYRTGRVAAVTEHAVVVADTENPLGGFTDAEYRELGTAFDNLVWPTDTDAFGEPTDIDSNGRVILFYTSAVNDLTRSGAIAITLGFFFARDLFPQQSGTVNGTALEGCAGSNTAEMFYLLVPDVVRGATQPAFSKEGVRRNTIGTLAHEFQHLINASRRLFIVKAAGTRWQEEVWLNEGLSHIAEELLFYRVSGLAPRQNIGLETLQARDGAIDAFNAYGIDNLGRYITYLQEPDTASLIGKDNLPTRGASWAFLRYAGDRRGGDERALWRSLVDTDRQGIANVTAALGVPALERMQEWTASVYADDAGFPTGAALSQPSWNFRSLTAALKRQSGEQIYPEFPLKVTPLGNGRTGFELFGGGGAFARFAVGSGGATLRLVSPDGQSAIDDARLRLSLVRIR